VRTFGAELVQYRGATCTPHIACQKEALSEDPALTRRYIDTSINVARFDFFEQEAVRDLEEALETQKAWCKSQVTIDFTHKMEEWNGHEYHATAETGLPPEGLPNSTSDYESLEVSSTSSHHKQNEKQLCDNDVMKMLLE
jgi:hypothetical protein